MRTLFFLSLILLAACSGRSKRAALQQEAATAGSTSTDTSSEESIEDLDSFFETTDPFATDPTLEEEAMNGTVTDDSDLITDVIAESADTEADPFADFFGSATDTGTDSLVNDTLGDTLSPDATPTDLSTGSILDPTTGAVDPATDPTLLGDTSLSGLNGLTMPSSGSNLDLNSILNSVSSSPTAGTSFDGGGGVSQILQLSPQLFE